MKYQITGAVGFVQRITYGLVMVWGKSNKTCLNLQ